MNTRIQTLPMCAQRQWTRHQLLGFGKRANHFTVIDTIHWQRALNCFLAGDKNQFIKFDNTGKYLVFCYVKIRNVFLLLKINFSNPQKTRAIKINLIQTLCVSLMYILEHIHKIIKPVNLTMNKLSKKYRVVKYFSFYMERYLVFSLINFMISS